MCWSETSTKTLKLFVGATTLGVSTAGEYGLRKQGMWRGVALQGSPHTEQANDASAEWMPKVEPKVIATPYDASPTVFDNRGNPVRLQPDGYIANVRTPGPARSIAPRIPADAWRTSSAFINGGPTITLRSDSFGGLLV